MEFGVLGLDGFHSSENALSLDGEMSKHKWAVASAARSVGSKQDGSGFCVEDWRSAKMAKTDGSDTALLLQSPRNLPFNPVSDATMLSFSSSSSKSDASALPYLQPMATKNTGYYSGSSNGMYVLNGVRGPFTASQWHELEHQALIYKYMTANEPIPAQLLIPIKRALESAGLFGFSARPTPWGWGPFHFGYANSNDPEPGRCRRTDGKKWRCSRDAMPDQKYCERHMNRGRHRSRKHVEAQPTNGHSVSGPTKLAAATLVPPPATGLSTSFDHSASNPSMSPLFNRSCQGLPDTPQLSFLTLSGSNPHSVPKHQSTPEESSNLFTITDGSSMMCSSDYGQSHQHLEMGLGVGAHTQNWTPSSWEPSMGGPLGEALQSGNGDCKKTSSSGLNLLPKGWEGMGGYQLSSSSPTGVLQKSARISLSNSSAGSSPRPDNSLCNDLLGSTTTLPNSSSLPALD